MKTAVVEKQATFGGTCLNVGCIPSKAMLHASELYEETGHNFAQMGINGRQAEHGSAGVAQISAIKRRQQRQRRGVSVQEKQDRDLSGIGRIIAPGKVEVKSADGKTQTLETKNIVIATGSDVARLPGIDIDEKRVVSSTGALELRTCRKSL